MQFWLVIRVVKGESFGWLLEWLKRVVLDGYCGG